MNANVNLEINHNVQPAATAVMLTDALRNYVTERLRTDYYVDKTPEETTKEHRNRRIAFNILGIAEREYQAELPLVLSRADYNNPIAIKINGTTLPDQCYNVLVDVINEELIQLAQCKGLISTDDPKKIAEEDGKMEFLLALLKKMGVTIHPNHVADLIAA